MFNAISFELRQQSRLLRSVVSFRCSPTSLLLSLKLFHRIVIRDHVAAAAIRPAIELPRKDGTGKRQCQRIGDIRRSQASLSHVLFFLELDFAAKGEFEFGPD